VFIGLPRLAAEQLPPAQVAGVGGIHVGEVHGFVVHRRVHAFAARQGLERVARRGDVERHAIARRGAGTGVAIVRQVRQHQRALLVRRPFEDPALELQRVVEGAGDEGRQVGLERIEVEQAEVVCLDQVHLEGIGVNRGARQEPGEQELNQKGPQRKQGRQHACRRPCHKGTGGRPAVLRDASWHRS
jgi:hypothetical protein